MGLEKEREKIEEREREKSDLIESLPRITRSRKLKLASTMTEDIPQQIKVELIAEPSISAMADWATKVDVAAITIAGS